MKVTLLTGYTHPGVPFAEHHETQAAFEAALREALDTVTPTVTVRWDGERYVIGEAEQ